MTRVEIEAEAQAYREQGYDVIAQVCSAAPRSPEARPEWHIAARVGGEYEVFRDVRSLAEALLAGKVGRL